VNLGPDPPIWWSRFTSKVGGVRQTFFRSRYEFRETSTVPNRPLASPPTSLGRVP